MKANIKTGEGAFKRICNSPQGECLLLEGWEFNIPFNQYREFIYYKGGEKDVTEKKKRKKVRNYLFFMVIFQKVLII